MEQYVVLKSLSPCEKRRNPIRQRPALTLVSKSFGSTTCWLQKKLGRQNPAQLKWINEQVAEVGILVIGKGFRIFVTWRFVSTMKPTCQRKSPPTRHLIRKRMPQRSLGFGRGSKKINKNRMIGKRKFTWKLTFSLILNEVIDILKEVIDRTKAISVLLAMSVCASSRLSVLHAEVRSLV